METFRERYAAIGEELDRRFQERFEMSMQEFFDRIAVKINPAEDDPKFDWHGKKEGDG